MTDTFEPTERTTVRRGDRAVYDLDVVKQVFDEAPFCHVGFIDGARPYVIPMLHARVDDDLLLHGSHATRLFRLLTGDHPVCVTATILDGLVLARSAFHHSANYRSAVVLGKPHPVESLADRRHALDALTDRLTPNRRHHLRPMTEKEVRGTAVVRLPIAEASCKVRTGPPVDEDEDRNWPVWAGVLPVVTMFDTPIPDEYTPEGALPDHIQELIQ
jgi:nitroimidazol reductase NimA-like FMN-containing flavoprotein (pyridoxamine 5'-phosphate oxidase superfamily)